VDGEFEALTLEPDLDELARTHDAALPPPRAPNCGRGLVAGAALASRRASLYRAASAATCSPFAIFHWRLYSDRHALHHESSPCDSFGFGRKASAGSNCSHDTQ
jgi:hypothetical protein